jgi:signal transduction histidine kinase
MARINTLSMEMLDYVGEQPLAVTSTNINQAIRSSIDALSQNQADKNVQIRFDLSPDVSQWDIDAKQFQRALVNLVVNAIDAVMEKQGGEIHISSSIRTDQRLVVAVSDNGCGMSSDQKNKIFELFFTTKGTKGNGLGLPMVSKFIELSGAKLMVNSEEGVGTTFKMIFPSEP